MNKIKIYRVIAILFVFLSLCGCKKIVKSSDNFVERKVLAKGEKELAEELAEKSAKELGKDYVGKSVGEQLVKNAVRKKVEEEMVKDGTESFFKYGSKKASKELIGVPLSSAKINLMNNYKKAYYQDCIKELRNTGLLKEQAQKTGNYLSKTLTRVLVRSKHQFIKGDKYKEWLISNGDELIKTGVKDPKILGDNMIKVMGKDSKYAITNSCEAHHIIGNETPLAAKKLKKCGIDINDPMNGIFLPRDTNSGLKGTIHRGRHYDGYKSYIEKSFANCKTKEDCFEVLDKIKDDLYKGKIQLYNDAKHKVNKTFKQVA